MIIEIEIIDLSRKYEGFLERKSRRRKIAIIFAIFWISYGIATLLAFFIRIYLLGAILFVVGYFALQLSGGLIHARWWPHETLETAAYAHLFKALKYLDLYFKEPLELYRKQAIGCLRTVILDLKYFPPIRKKYNSILLGKEFVEPINELSINLEQRVLPLILRHTNEDMKIGYDKLKGLVSLFYDPYIEGIRKCNKELEKLKVIKITEKRIRDVLLGTIGSMPGRIFISFLLGYAIISMVYLISCQALGIDFIIYVRNNLSAFISVGAVISTFIGGVLIFKK